MQLPGLNRRWAVVSVAIACGVSALAWVLNFNWVLTLPGALLAKLISSKPALLMNLPLRLALNVVAISSLLYFAGALLRFGDGVPKQPAPSGSRGMLTFWLVLLVPWVVFGPLSAMAFDGGYTVDAYVFFWSTITFPVSVLLAAIFRRWFRYAVFLPVLNFVACFGVPLVVK